MRIMLKSYIEEHYDIENVFEIFVSVQCDCKATMKIWSHNTKDRFSFKCESCGEKRNFTILPEITPPDI